MRAIDVALNLNTDDSGQPIEAKENVAEETDQMPILVAESQPASLSLADEFCKEYSLEKEDDEDDEADFSGMKTAYHY